MFRRIYIMLALFVPVSFVFPQSDTVKDEKNKTKIEKPEQIVTTDVFGIENLSFNKKIDPTGKGELLQVEFALKNNTDSPLELYIFMMAQLKTRNGFGTLSTTEKSL